MNANNAAVGITLEDLDNDKDNKITPEMLFGPKEEKKPETDINSLRALLGSPVDDFLEKLKRVGIPVVGIPYDSAMFEAGMEYIKNGLSVIPVGMDKKPLIAWKEFQERKATQEEFHNWIRTYKDMQLGVVTGKISNIIVVDIDNPNLDISWLPETTVVKTGSGGKHYYYSYIEGFSNRARIKEFIDIRADGGYVVVPPSKNLNGPYSWEKRVPLAVFPKHLFFKEQEELKISEPVDSEYSGFSEGQRNQEMTRYIGHILTKVHPKEWNNIAYPMIELANSRNRPPLPSSELKTIFSSICNRELRDTSNRWYNYPEVKPFKPENSPTNLMVKDNYQLRYTWGTRTLDTNFSIIKRGNFIVLGAKSGSGKTTFAFDMAQKNAVLGHKVLFISLEMDEKEVKDAVARRRAGITVEEEYDYNIPANKQLIFENKIAEINSLTNLYFKGVRRGGGLKWEQILDIIYGYNDLDMIFIDNLDLIEGERGENDWDRQKRVVKKIMGFTSDKRVPIVLIHHYRKIMGKEGKVANVDDLSGSKKICDGADRVLNISRNYDLKAEYPLKYRSLIHLQKGREYDNAMVEVFFIRGTFVDGNDVPSMSDYYGGFVPELETTLVETPNGRRDSWITDN